MDIKHIFFDLDHTLWDFEYNSNKTFQHIFQRNNVNVNFDDFMLKYKPINQKYWKLYREDKVSKSDLRYGRLREVFDDLKFNANDELIHTLSVEYIDYLPSNNTLFDGAMDILDYLKPKYKMHIITNGFEEVQHTKLKNADILPFFTNIVTSERVGVKKPNPKIFHFAMDLSKAKPEESIMIGDNFEADILGAKSVGMHVVFCEFNGEIATEKVLSIKKLNQLKNIL